MDSTQLTSILSEWLSPKPRQSTSNLEVGTISEQAVISAVPRRSSRRTARNWAASSTRARSRSCRSPRATSLQILALSPGTFVDLPDNTALGRNSQNVSVNGARRTQNNFEINGIDANSLSQNNAISVAVPAPETIQEFKVQTSLYDATFGRGAGGSVQAVTRSGTTSFTALLYEYFRNDALTPITRF